MKPWKVCLALLIIISFSLTGCSDSTTNPPPAGPYIVSSIPASGSTVSPQTSTITMTFSEPIAEEFNPLRISGHLLNKMVGEPELDASGTVMTVTLEPPLAAGTRFFAVFDSIPDLEGNWNTVIDSVSFMVQGTPELIPINEGEVSVFFTQETGEMPFFELVRIENVVREGEYERAFYSDFDFSELEDREYMKLDAVASELQFLAFDDIDDDPREIFHIEFDPEIVWFPLPPVADHTWSGTSDLVADSEAMGYVDYSGVIVEQTDLVVAVYELYGEGAEDFAWVWENCWKIELSYDVWFLDIALGGYEHIDKGTDTIWYAPGVGEVKIESENTEFEDGEPVGIYNEVSNLMPFDMDEE
ncbi:MAG: Ig-like domain-containing protein [bacterium]|nr:Ig-like domain-containing protein [bacterium]